MSTTITGYQSVAASSSDYNARDLQIRRAISQLSTATLVKVMAVTVTPGDLGPTGFVDVQPLVSQLDGAGAATPHGVVHNLPFVRAQSGTSAIIMDPAVGDIGLVVFCSRDVSAVKRTRQQSNPGSRRKYDWADGIYAHGLLSDTPLQYVRFSANGIEMQPLSGKSITLKANGAPIIVEGDLHVTGAVIAGFGGGDQVGLQTHTHAHGPAPDPGS